MTELFDTKNMIVTDRWTLLKAKLFGKKCILPYDYEGNAAICYKYKGVMYYVTDK